MISTKHIVNNILDVSTSWIFEHYCNLSEKLVGQDAKIKSLFNPSDSVPSMVIFCREDKYFFKDFSTNRGGDSVKLVMFLFNLSFGHAVNKIIEDYQNHLKISGTNTSDVVIKQRARYNLESYDTRLWNRGDAEYWTSYGIDSELLTKYNVKPLDSFVFSKNEEGTYDFFLTQRPYVYGYFREDGTLCKIYQPYIKDKKFMKINSYIQGMDQLKFNKPPIFLEN